MSSHVWTLPPDKLVSDALDLMVIRGIGSIPIVDRSTLSGIVTERDIVKRIRENVGVLRATLGEIASKPVITVAPDTKIWEAFTIMLRNKIRRLPVVRKKELVGIVTERDLFKWVVKVAYEPNIPADVKKLIARSD